MTMSIHGSLHAVFRVGKPQYDLLRFDFQVGLWRDRRLPDRRCCRRCLLLLPVLREPAPGEQPNGAERSAGDVQLSLCRSCRRQPELRQLLPLQHRPIRYLLHSGGPLQPHLMRKGGEGGSCWSINRVMFISLSHTANISVSKCRLIQHPFLSSSPLKQVKKKTCHLGEGKWCRSNVEELVSFESRVILLLERNPHCFKTSIGSVCVAELAFEKKVKWNYPTVRLVHFE